MMVESQGPVLPETRPVAVERGVGAVAVLDLSVRCHDPSTPCSKLMAPLAEFLDRARASGVPIVYTISLSAKGTPPGEVAAPLKRQESEPVIHPDAYDKFMGGELHDFLRGWGAKSLVIVGAATNFAVLYTATTAARVHHYNVVFPVDGVIARGKYEQEYALHQLNALPPGSRTPIQFTTLSDIAFQ